MTQLESFATLSAGVLDIDPELETGRIGERIREQVFRRLRRKGAVLGLSGGIDSSVAAAISVRSLGTDRVLGLLMPERESSPDSLELGRMVADHLGIRAVEEDVTAILEAAGCYSRRDEAIRSVLPEYATGSTCKIVLPSLMNSNHYHLL